MPRQSAAKSPRPAPVGVFDALLDDMANQIAARVIQRIEEYLEARGAGARSAALRLDQAAAALNISLSEVRRRVASGELGSRRVGGAILVPRLAIEEFLASQATNGTVH